MPKMKRPDGRVVSVSERGVEPLLRRGYTPVDDEAAEREAAEAAARQEAEDAAKREAAEREAAEAAAREQALDGLSVDELVAVLENDTATYADAGSVEVDAAIEQLRNRADNGDEDAQAAVELRGLTNAEGQPNG